MDTVTSPAPPSAESAATSSGTTGTSRASSCQSSQSVGEQTDTQSVAVQTDGLSDAQSNGRIDGQSEDKAFAFFETPYANKAIELLQERRVVRKAVKSAAYVYLDQKLAVGDLVTFQVGKKEVRVSNCSFFAVTTCSLKRIASDPRHTNYICSKNCSSKSCGRSCSKAAACSKGDSFCIPIDDLLEVGDKFQVEVATGALFLKYERKAGKVRPVPRDQELHPLLIIDSDYTELRIVSNDEFNDHNKRTGFEVLTTSGSSLTSPGKLLQATLSHTVPITDVPASAPATLSVSGTRHAVTGSKAGGTPASARVVNKIAPTLVSEQAQTKVLFTFLDPWYENANIRTSACLLTASVRPEPEPGTRNKGSKIVYLTPRLFSSSNISLLVEKVTEKASSGCCFVFGLTDCNFKSLRSNDCHSQQMCAPSRPCKGSSIMYTVSSKLADGPGSVITFERLPDGKFKIRCGNNVNKKLEWTQPADFSKAVHAFLVLNGDATEVRCLNEAESADLMLKQMQRSKVPLPVRAKSVKKYRFMIPDYKWQSLTVSADQKQVRIVDSVGARIVYLDTDLITHTPLKLRVESKSDGPKDNSFGFFFLVSSCSPDNIKKQDWHSTGVCHNDVKCRGLSQAYGVTEKLDIESIITITRVCNGFITIQVDGKTFEMQDHKGLFCGYPVCPALRLTGCVTSVSIVDKNEKHVSPAVARPEIAVNAEAENQSPKKSEVPAPEAQESPPCKKAKCSNPRMLELQTPKKTETPVPTISEPAVPKLPETLASKKAVSQATKKSGVQATGKSGKKGKKQAAKAAKKAEASVIKKTETEIGKKNDKSAGQEVKKTKDASLVQSVDESAVAPNAPDTKSSHEDAELQPEPEVPAIETPSDKPPSPPVVVNEPLDFSLPPTPVSAAPQVASASNDRDSKRDTRQAGDDPSHEHGTFFVFPEIQENGVPYDPESETESGTESEAEFSSERESESDTESEPEFEPEAEATPDSPQTAVMPETRSPPKAEDEDPFTAVVRRKRKPRTRSLRTPDTDSQRTTETPDLTSPSFEFEFLSTPYPNSNIAFLSKTRVERLVHNEANIVYLNRRLAPGDSLNLRVLSFGQAEPLNLIFGITTCDTRTIAAHKSHVKSFCTNDGRPCGGQSMVCRLDRGVRGSNIISFKKVPEGINFLSDGFLVTQFKDLKNLFKRTPVTPFLALRGDVESIAIMDSVSPMNPPDRLSRSSSPSVVPSESQTRPPPGFSSLRRISPTPTHSTLQPLRLVSRLKIQPQLPPQPQTPEPVTPEPVARKSSISLSLDSIEAQAAAMFLPRTSSTNTRYRPVPESSLLSYEDRIIRPPVTPSPIHRPVSQPAVPCDDAGDDMPEPMPRPARVAEGPTFRKWYNNLDVSYSDNVIVRTPSESERSYIFASEIRINESISFRVQDVDTGLADNGSVFFGLTSTPILRVNLTDMPADPRVLTQSQNGCKWFLSHNLFYTIGVMDGLTLTRTESGITVTMEPNIDEREGLLMIQDVDPASIVYPFFHLGGCVRSVRLLTRDAVEPISFQNQSRLYLTSFYFSILNSALRQQ